MSKRRIVRLNLLPFRNLKKFGKKRVVVPVDHRRHAGGVYNTIFVLVVRSKQAATFLSNHCCCQQTANKSSSLLSSNTILNLKPERSHTCNDFQLHCYRQSLHFINYEMYFMPPNFDPPRLVRIRKWFLNMLRASLA